MLDRKAGSIAYWRFALGYNASKHNNHDNAISNPTTSENRHG